MGGEQERYWDSQAEIWGENTRRDLFLDFDLDRVLSSLPIRGHHLRILDIGTGAGKVAVQAALLGHTVVGLDSSSEMLRQARITAKAFKAHVMLVKEDAYFVKFPTGLFDVVVAKDVLFCMDDSVNAVKHWTEFLNPGGALIIVDGNYLFHRYKPDYDARRKAVISKYGIGDFEAMMGPGTDHETLFKIVKDYYPNRVRRPSWDMWFMSSLGFENFTIDYRDRMDCDVFTDKGLIKLPCSYAICACKKERNPSCIPTHASLEYVGPKDAELLAALGNETRINIIRMLEIGGMDVAHICSQLSLKQNAVSYHLKILKDAGLLVAVQEGRNMRYSLKDARSIHSILNTIHMMRK